jgi:hypothetical protein
MNSSSSVNFFAEVPRARRAALIWRVTERLVRYGGLYLSRMEKPETKVANNTI